jgi:hypothetical protein
VVVPRTRPGCPGRREGAKRPAPGQGTPPFSVLCAAPPPLGLASAAWAWPCTRRPPELACFERTQWPIGGRNFV